MDVFEALYTTRAMRRVKEDPIPDEIIKSMIDSAIRAPSGSNRQDWRFVAVTDQEVRTQLADIYKETWDYYVKSFYNSSSDLGASNLKDKEQIESVRRISNSASWLAENYDKVPLLVLAFSRNDPTGSSIYPAIWSLMLAARSHGIGTCLTTVMSFKTEEVYEVLDIPADKGWALNATITAGFPLGKWGVAERKPVEEVTFLNKWGQSPDWNLTEPLWNY
ncbi:nitroreductase family protein [Acidimicrobiaceae bacterium]|nr:nitroreductase family protein [Acidimicrobiaceae bacterium]MDA9712659.1 nitroreductase family protein [Acidimicrobiaceae bacterium]